ncbi:MAG TPA: beta-propeller fold lactonase family protein, partial [Steroidobacteraceae bacterium]|nr:beta-propeller fold lactonase family protein [Steroidobacteraceae bacterium]
MYTPFSSVLTRARSALFSISAVLVLCACGGGGRGAAVDGPSTVGNPAPIAPNQPEPPVPPAPAPAPEPGPAPTPIPEPEPEPVPNPTPSAPSPAAVAFVAQESQDSISIYKTDTTSGELSWISTVALTTGSSPRHVAYDATHQRLYIANFGRNRIEVADVDTTTGALSTPTLASMMSEPVKLAVDPLGRFLMVAYGTDSSYRGVMAFRINPVTGSLVDVNYPALSRAPNSVTIDATGRYAFVSMKFGGLMSYNIDQASGALTQTRYSPIGINDIVFDPTSQHLYASQSGTPNTLVFSMQDDGSIDAVEFKDTTGFPTVAVAMDPEAEYLFALDGFTKAVNVL